MFLTGTESKTYCQLFCREPAPVNPETPGTGILIRKDRLRSAMRNGRIIFHEYRYRQEFKIAYASYAFGLLFSALG